MLVFCQLNNVERLKQYKLFPQRYSKSINVKIIYFLVTLQVLKQIYFKMYTDNWAKLATLYVKYIMISRLQLFYRTQWIMIKHKNAMISLPFYYHKK